MTRCSAPQDHPGGMGRQEPACAAATVLSVKGLEPRPHAGYTHGAGLAVGRSCSHHMAPNIADGRQQESMEGENPASSMYVTSDFLSPPQEQELRVFFSPFFKKLGLVNKGTEPSASFPHQEGICSRKGGHFDKSCELRWVQGNFLAHLGLPELLPQRAVSSPPGSEGERDSLHWSSWVGRRAQGWGGTWTGAAPLPVLLPSPPSVDGRSSPLPLVGVPRRLDAVCEGPRGPWGVFLLGGARTSG